MKVKASQLPLIRSDKMKLYEVSFRGREAVSVQAESKLQAQALALAHLGLPMSDYRKIISTKIIASEVAWL